MSSNNDHTNYPSTYNPNPSNWGYQPEAQPCYTGIAPTMDKSNFQQTPDKTDRDLIDQFYIEPLKAMSGHQGLICLTICFPLYEKCLRFSEAIPEDENFSQGHRVFKVIGGEFEISEAVAYQFWQCWRNGLLHRGMPKANDTFTAWLTKDGDKALSFDLPKNHLIINPWLFRDRIIELLNKNKRVWKDADYPLVKEIQGIS